LAGSLDNKCHDSFTARQANRRHMPGSTLIAVCCRCSSEHLGGVQDNVGGQDNLASCIAVRLLLLLRIGTSLSAYMPQTYASNIAQTKSAVRAYRLRLSAATRNVAPKTITTVAQRSPCALWRAVTKKAAKPQWAKLFRPPPTHGFTQPTASPLLPCIAAWQLPLTRLGRASLLARPATTLLSTAAKPAPALLLSLLL
jgi:hypothetical protein